jgi:hypothetical protein
LCGRLGNIRARVPPTLGNPTHREQT